MVDRKVEMWVELRAVKTEQELVELLASMWEEEQADAWVC